VANSDAKKPTGAASSGAAKAKVSLSSLSAEDVSSLKDELLRNVATRASNAHAEAYGRHSNVHSSNSNAELAKVAAVRKE
jgi:hypothetical protein